MLKNTYRLEQLTDIYIYVSVMHNVLRVKMCFGMVEADIESQFDVANI